MAKSSVRDTITEPLAAFRSNHPDRRRPHECRSRARIAPRRIEFSRALRLRVSSHRRSRRGLKRAAAPGNTAAHSPHADRVQASQLLLPRNRTFGLRAGRSGETPYSTEDYKLTDITAEVGNVSGAAVALNNDGRIAYNNYATVKRTSLTMAGRSEDFSFRRLQSARKRTRSTRTPRSSAPWRTYPAHLIPRGDSKVPRVHRLLTRVPQLCSSPRNTP